MIVDDRYLIVRAAALYVPVMLTVVLWAWRRPSSRQWAGAVLASLWNLPVLLAVHLAAVRIGWWQFDAHGGLLLGMPVDLYLAWAWLWGAVPALAFRSLPLGSVALVALAADLLLMPAASPVVNLGPGWLVGELLLLTVGLLPAQLLARWTSRDEHLIGRAVLQVIAFGGLVLFVLPAVVIEASGSATPKLWEWPRWQLNLIAQTFILAGLPGVSAVQEFVQRGGGTPVPFDPPRRLVTSGVYSYLGNPMQTSGVLTLLLLGLVTWNVWLAAAAVTAHVYSLGLAGWDEDEDLRQRFEDDWIIYRHAVRRWIPRFRPWRRPGVPDARLFVSERCGMCREMAKWFMQRGARGLAIVPAETHPSGSLTRITYESGDDSPPASGIVAVARALEHVHIGWAMAAFFMRLPLVSTLAQLLADASGGGPRVITSKRSAPHGRLHHGRAGDRSVFTR
jgi:protein-S-isoprenylcysteine O-methyltransferase Ste14